MVSVVLTSSSTVLGCMMSAMMGCTVSDVHACCVQDTLMSSSSGIHPMSIHECTAQRVDSEPWADSKQAKKGV